MKREFKVGDKVFDYRFGEGVVKNRSRGFYSLEVEFKKTVKYYTPLGKFDTDDYSACLFHLDEIPSQERVVLVSVNGIKWRKRVLIKKTSEGWVCWNKAETILESFNECEVTCWDLMKELEEETIVELTLQDITDGKGVGVPSHLIRIKE